MVIQPHFRRGAYHVSDAWKKLDLGGGGLQSANLRIAARLRKRGIALALHLLFPLGIHRDYLLDRRGAWLFRAALLAALAFWYSGHVKIAAITAGAILAAGVYDLCTFERRCAAANKQIRKEIFFSQTSGAPADYKGRRFDAPSDSPQDSLPR